MDKIDKLDERLDRIEHTLIKNTIVLEEHQRRSLALEKHVQLVEVETKRVSKHVDGVNFAAKVIVGLLGLAGGVMGLVTAARSLGLVD